MNVLWSAAAGVLTFLDQRGLIPSPVPRRQERLRGQSAQVDGIDFSMPVNSEDTPALMAGFTIDLPAAEALLPGDEVHAVRLPRDRSLLIVTVIDYRTTDIGRYIEYSIAVACTHGAQPAPPLLPGLLRRVYGTGQYVLDLPVSTEVSVKGGKGIWGMPKHRASLDFVISDAAVSSQYDHDGKLAVRVEIEKPSTPALPLSLGAVNYCAFRGMLMKSRVYFSGEAHLALGSAARGRLVIGDADRVAPLHGLDIDDSPLFVAWMPSTHGVLDDYLESWFLTSSSPGEQAGEGLDSVIDLGVSQEWPSPPHR